jgi:hypothetical protein
MHQELTSSNRAVVGDPTAGGGSGKTSLWERWKSVAHTAAAVQSNVLLWVLYFIVLVPIAFARRPFDDTLGRQTDRPAWQPRPPGPKGPEGARRQY